MYHIKGKVTLQAHVDIPAGTSEEEYARRGFFGRTSHLYRSEPPGTGPTQVKVQHQGRISTITYPFNPINTVGWKGDLTVWQLNIRDIRPISSERYHLPPTAHITFLMQNAAPNRVFHPRGADCT
ncbi:MAG: hypothetical protein K8R59_13240 [Thermoanaerobaculales bacterium]|nr:hypothetical protein [Thermoanaerobaculales bacterium]